MVKDIKHKVLFYIDQAEDVYEHLVKEYTYSQIGETYIRLIAENLIIYKNKKYEITEGGKKELEQSRNYTNIEILNNEKLDKKDCLRIDEVYIPKYHKGGFIKTKN